MRGIFITGTDTEVGKTFATACIAALLLKTGLRVGIMKPVASGAYIDNGKPVSGDVAFFKKLFGFNDDPKLINPYCFIDPIAPGLAAGNANVKVSFDIINGNYNKLAKIYDILLVEGAGGLLSPLTETFLTNADLAKAMDLPVVVVSKAGLGAINQTVITVDYARRVKDLTVLGVIFNCLESGNNDPSIKTNPGVVKEMTNARIIGSIPYCGDAEEISVERLQKIFQCDPGLFIN